MASPCPVTIDSRTSHQTGWTIKRFVRTARRYRTVTIRAGSHTLTAAEPPPADLAEALAKIHALHAH